MLLGKKPEGLARGEFTSFKGSRKVPVADLTACPFVMERRKDSPDFYGPYRRDVTDFDRNDRFIDPKLESLVVLNVCVCVSFFFSFRGRRQVY